MSGAYGRHQTWSCSRRNGSCRSTPPAWRAAETAPPRRAICLRQVIAGEERRFAGNLFGIAVLAALAVGYVWFFLMPRGPRLIGPPALMIFVVSLTTLGTANRIRRSF